MHTSIGDYIFLASNIFQDRGNLYRITSYVIRSQNERTSHHNFMENVFLRIWLIFGYVISILFILNKCLNGHNLIL